MDRTESDQTRDRGEAWRVEERRYDDKTLTAVWFLVDRSPYTVAGEAIQPNGQIRYITEIAIP